MGALAQVLMLAAKLSWGAPQEKVWVQIAAAFLGQTIRPRGGLSPSICNLRHALLYFSYIINRNLHCLDNNRFFSVFHFFAFRADYNNRLLKYLF
jgi:hypothetical protein